jgi:hypothetical protein
VSPFFFADDALTVASFHEAFLEKLKYCLPAIAYCALMPTVFTIFAAHGPFLWVFVDPQVSTACFA